MDTDTLRGKKALVWSFWFLVLLALAMGYGLPVERASGVDQDGWKARAISAFQDIPVLTGRVIDETQPKFLFPWHPRSRYRKWALIHYQTVRRAYRRAWWMARMTYWRAVWAANSAKLVLAGVLTMATVVDMLTRAQIRSHMGALPMLYGLLETLRVRHIINQCCPSKREVDIGTVALVLVLNRLVAPRALYKVADWVAQTVLVYTLGVPAEKFNDDRLARALDVIAKHKRKIWLAIVHEALWRFDIDLSFIFYDLTAFVMEGEYKESKLVGYGFAHNTPSNKQKVKIGLSVAADGGIPTEYDAHAGRTADVATVQDNMERLCRLLKHQGYPLNQVVIVGDRAMLNDKLAVLYEQKGLKYLGGLQARKKAHRNLLKSVPTKQFYAYPLDKGGGPQSQGYYGIPCAVTFEHEGKRVTHRGLLMLSGPIRQSLRNTRAQRLMELRSELLQVRAKIGQKRYKTVKSVQARADTRLRRSKVGKLVRAQAYADEKGQVCLRWRIDHYALWQAGQTEGRYLLVTNDFSLAPQRMFDLYRSKDGVEKRFTVSKQVLKVRPIYLHKDNRIEAMLLINMIALLAYSLLERQAHNKGLPLTMRRIIEQLEGLTVIETQCWDGSVLRRLTPLSEEQALLLTALADILNQLCWPRLRPMLPTPQVRWLLPGSSGGDISLLPSVA